MFKINELPSFWLLLTAISYFTAHVFYYGYLFRFGVTYQLNFISIENVCNTAIAMFFVFLVMPMAYEQNDKGFNYFLFYIIFSILTAFYIFPDLSWGTLIIFGIFFLVGILFKYFMKQEKSNFPWALKYVFIGNAFFLLALIAGLSKGYYQRSYAMTEVKDKSYILVKTIGLNEGIFVEFDKNADKPLPYYEIKELKNLRLFQYEF